MLVYGERSREVDIYQLANQLTKRAWHIQTMPVGPARHDALTNLFIDASELEQGIAAYRDNALGYQQQGKSSAHQLWNSDWLGRALHYSATEVGLLADHRPMPQLVLKRVAQSFELWKWREVRSVTVKSLEGFAYYSLYPEMYMQAAYQFLDETQATPTVIVGILSIGAPLAAVITATLRANHRSTTMYTVRPHGHPFSRQLDLAGEGAMLARRFAAHQQLHLIVDEGPGLSASSFGAVADWLEEHGLKRNRIVFFPSHANPLGPQASPAHRARWTTARKYFVPFEDVFIKTGKLAEWCRDLLGDVGELADISGGRWRAGLIAEAEWPPLHLWQERRKYRTSVAGQSWLLKFAGLGHYGEDKLPLAQSLADAGFIVPIVGLRHGFMVSHWLEEARPLTAARRQEIDRAAFVAFLARYIAHRARHFPTLPTAGATPTQLFAMMRYNTAQALGEDAAQTLDKWQPHLFGLTAVAQPVLTDNKMQAWEWLVLPNGRFLKADALDHHDSHDLIGAQDIAWDVVGAILELGLDEDETRQLLLISGLMGRLGLGQRELDFYTYAYIAFQIGYYTLAAQAMGDNAEAQRLRDWAARWVQMMQARLNAMLDYDLG